MSEHDLFLALRPAYRTAQEVFEKLLRNHLRHGA